jgi:hypothetical protein
MFVWGWSCSFGSIDPKSYFEYSFPIKGFSLAKGNSGMEGGLKIEEYDNNE